MANVEANKAYSEHLERMDELGRAAATCIMAARLAVRHARPEASEMIDQASSLAQEFVNLANELVAGQDSAAALAAATGSRAAIYQDGRITVVWGEA